MKNLPCFLALATIIGSAAPTLAQDAEEVRSVIEQHYAAIHANDLVAVFEHHLPEMTWFPNDGRVMFESGTVESAERMGATLDYGTINVISAPKSTVMWRLRPSTSSARAPWRARPTTARHG